MNQTLLTRGFLLVAPLVLLVAMRQDAICQDPFSTDPFATSNGPAGQEESIQFRIAVLDEQRAPVPGVEI